MRIQEIFIDMNYARFDVQYLNNKYLPYKIYIYDNEELEYFICSDIFSIIGISIFNKTTFVEILLKHEDKYFLFSHSPYPYYRDPSVGCLAFYNTIYTLKEIIEQYPNFNLKLQHMFSHI